MEYISKPYDEHDFEAFKEEAEKKNDIEAIAFWNRQLNKAIEEQNFKEIKRIANIITQLSDNYA